jgi:hypothetical protein
MDIYCPVRGCGEPWDHDTLHEVAEEEGKSYNEVMRAFQSKGCEVIFGQPHNIRDDEPVDKSYGLPASMAAEALYDLLGDDMDGAAAMMEDMGY